MLDFRKPVTDTVYLDGQNLRLPATHIGRDGRGPFAIKMVDSANLFGNSGRLTVPGGGVLLSDVVAGGLHDLTIVQEGGQDRADALVAVEGGNDVCLENITLIGGAPDGVNPRATRGFWLGASRMENGKQTEATRNIDARNLRAICTWHTGISVCSAGRNLVADSLSHGSAGSGFKSSPTVEGGYTVFRNCYADGCAWQGGQTDNTPLEDRRVMNRNVWWEGGGMVRNRANGLLFVDAEMCGAKRMLIAGNSEHGVQIVNSKSVALEDCVFDGNGVASSDYNVVRVIAESDDCEVDLIRCRVLNHRNASPRLRLVAVGKNLVVRMIGCSGFGPAQIEERLGGKVVIEDGGGNDS